VGYSRLGVVEDGEVEVVWSRWKLSHEELYRDVVLRPGYLPSTIELK
jgi:hypothetical protein